MLYSYQQETQRLISDKKQELINPGSLRTYINKARRQIAGEGECVRVLGTISTVVAQRNYDFASITLAPASVQAVLNVRSVLYGIGSGQQWVAPRNWEWFQLYHLNTPVPASGAPTTWSQFAQGATGSFYVDPLPDIVYGLTLDCVCYPIDLTDDATAEAIPILWTEAVPYFAAYLAFLSVQNMESAKNMFTVFETFMGRARQAANPSVNRSLYQQAVDPAQINKLGIQRSDQGGA